MTASSSSSSYAVILSPAADDEKMIEKSMVWRLCIGMDGMIKRPYDPSIELVTRPGKPIQQNLVAAQVAKKMNLLPVKENIAPTLCIVLKSRYNFDYAVEGLRLPAGINRNDLQCYWRSSDQHLVVWASCKAWEKASTEERSSPSILTGVSLLNGGFSATCVETEDPEWHCLKFCAKEQRLDAGVGDMMKTHMISLYGGRRQVRWNYNHVIVDPVAYCCELVDAEKATLLESADKEASMKLEAYLAEEDLFDGDGDYEKQYWFRNPKIEINHYGKDADDDTGKMEEDQEESKETVEEEEEKTEDDGKDEEEEVKEKKIRLEEDKEGN